MENAAAQEDGRDAGRIPRTIECEVAEDLVNACVPGDVITVCGIVKVRARSRVRATVRTLYAGGAARAGDERGCRCGQGWLQAQEPLPAVHRRAFHHKLEVERLGEA